MLTGRTDEPGKMIRKFNESDLKDVLDIWLEGNIQAHPFIPESFWRGNLQFMTEALPKAEVYVYEKEGEVLAFVGLQDDYIAGCFTRNSHRSRGIGRKMIGYLQSKHNILTLRVYEKNGRALRFYEKNGFSIVSKNRDEMTGEEEYLMHWENN